MAEILSCFAATAPGLEPLTAGELRALRVAKVEPEAGGVSFEASLEQLYAANLWLRTASRVLVRIADFRAQAFYELERHARKVSWERYLAPGASAKLSVTCRKSKLYHSGAVAERVLDAIERRVKLAGAEVGGEEDEEEEGGGNAQQLFVRFFHDRCTLSADSSGELLHRRGYRQAVSRAPLRETLAAAMLLASGWKSEAPLLDPMCGSGTIPIEAALLARRIAPGIGRDHAFAHWQGFDRALWSRLVEQAREQQLPRCPAPIAGSDNNSGALAAARSNAERAGVLEDLSLSICDVAAVKPPEGGPGWCLTNPPYGKRVGESRHLTRLFQTIGETLRGRMAGWTAGLLVPDPQLERALGLELKEALHTRNGGIPVRLLVGRIPG
jgi:putative N6-adenine-specific DNA methylase